MILTMLAAPHAAARLLLTGWVLVWSTGRVDAALHLTGWVILGAAFAAYTKPTWYAAWPYAVDAASSLSRELGEVLPESDLFALLVAFALGSAIANDHSIVVDGSDSSSWASRLRMS